MYVIRYKGEREYWSKKHGWSEDIFSADLFKDQKTKLPVNGEYAELWDFNEIQFARLIAESEMAGVYEGEALEAMLESMDLSKEEFAVLTDRAMLAWETFKKKV